MLTQGVSADGTGLLLPSYPQYAPGQTVPNVDPCHPKSTDIPNGNPDFPNGCNWPSIHSMNAAPVVSEGDQTNWNNAFALPTDGFHGPGTGLPAGTAAHPKKYLVSVLANGYQLGGGHFTSPMNADAAGGTFATVHVNLNPYPIPLGTMRIRVFNDNAGTNGQWDQESEAGLPGFSAKLSDYNGLVSVDYYGNPLCTTYVTHSGQTVIDKNGVPTILKLGTGCVSDAQGDIVIPNLPPNRYGTSVVPPDGQTWIQTTTLEGNHDWDVWVQPNDTGFDTELVVGGEAVPFVDFGYVSPLALRTPATVNGEITGRVMKSSVYFPGYSGLQGTANVTAGTGGIKLTDPIEDAYIVLSDLNQNDQSVYAGQANADGTFDLKHVRDGDYSITVWDVRQEWILDTFNVSVRNGQTVALGNIPLAGWFTDISGTVFIDKNGNGKRDPGEDGVKKFTMQNLDRTNNTMESGQQTADTDDSGYYHFAELYPLGQFSVLQFFNTRYKTTGLTWQTCNDKQEHTVLTAVVDLSYNAIIGQCGRVDVGVHAVRLQGWRPGRHRRHRRVRLDSAEVQRAPGPDAAPGRPGIPGIDFKLYQPVKDPTTGAYALGADGAYVKQVPATDEAGGDSTQPDGVQTYTSENYGRPKGCYVMDVNGHPFTNQDAQWGTPASAAGKECVESPMTGLAFGLGDDGNHGPQTVDGNYGLAAPCQATTSCRPSCPRTWCSTTARTSTRSRPKPT